MKLIITSMDKDKVTYIEGEEVEVSLDSIHARIAEIDNLIGSTPSAEEFEALLQEERAKIEKVVEAKRIEIQGKHVELDKEMESFVSQVNEEYANKESEYMAIMDQASKDNAKYARERAKLFAILSSMEDLEKEAEAISAKEIEEEVVEEDTVVEEAVEEVNQVEEVEVPTELEVEPEAVVEAPVEAELVVEEAVAQEEVVVEEPIAEEPVVEVPVEQPAEEVAPVVEPVVEEVKVDSQPVDIAPAPAPRKRIIF